MFLFSATFVVSCYVVLDHWAQETCCNLFIFGIDRTSQHAKKKKKGKNRKEKKTKQGCYLGHMIILK